MNDKYLKLTLVVIWDLKSPSVEIHRCGLSKRLSDEKTTEVTYHRFLPGQQLQCDEAMTIELSQVLAADAVRRLSQEEELDLKPESLLRMRWVLTWKYSGGGDRNAKARLVIFGYQHPEIRNVPTAALGKMSRHLLLQACALDKLRVPFGDVSSAFLQTSASEEHQVLTIKAPPEVGICFPILMKNLLDMCVC